jgi:hypothetical protein
MFSRGLCRGAAAVRFGGMVSARRDARWLNTGGDGAVKRELVLILLLIY